MFVRLANKNHHIALFDRRADTSHEHIGGPLALAAVHFYQIRVVTLAMVTLITLSIVVAI